MHYNISFHYCYNTYNICIKKICKIFLGATPDGIVRDADAIDGLLEIKCPFSICSEVPTADNLPYLKLNDNGEIQLHQNHAYFHQIQTLLGVFKMSWCDFFVFTHKGYF